MKQITSGSHRFPPAKGIGLWLYCAEWSVTWMIRVDKLVGERVLFFGELFFVVLGNLPRDLDFLQLSKSNISPHPKKFHSCWNPSVFVELYGLVPARWHAWKGAIYGAVWVFIREKSPLHSRCSEFSRLNPPPPARWTHPKI